MTLPQDEEHALDSTTTLETEQKHESSGAKFIVQDYMDKYLHMCKSQQLFGPGQVEKEFQR